MNYMSHCAASVLLGSVIFVALGAELVKAETVIIEKVMPAPIVETAPATRPGKAWVPGHWVWRGRRGEWFWVKGHYVKGIVPAMPAVIAETPPPRPSPAHVWVQGHWVWEGGRWNWHTGVWFR